MQKDKSPKLHQKEQMLTKLQFLLFLQCYYMQLICFMLLI